MQHDRPRCIAFRNITSKIVMKILDFFYDFMTTFEAETMAGWCVKMYQATKGTCFQEGQKTYVFEWKDL